MLAPHPTAATTEAIQRIFKACFGKLPISVSGISANAGKRNAFRPQFFLQPLVVAHPG